MPSRGAYLDIHVSALWFLLALGGGLQPAAVAAGGAGPDQARRLHARGAAAPAPLLLLAGQAGSNRQRCQEYAPYEVHPCTQRLVWSK